MIDFVDGITPLNRLNMMAMQGFIPRTTVFNNDGSITETNEKGETLITSFVDGKVIESFSGEKTITRTTIFNSDGSITEEITA